jgi:hypothetical protein
VALPRPEPGLVIRYAYLWDEERRKGRDESSKDRPCAIILAAVAEGDDLTVTVLPITHSPPRHPTLAVEIPPDTKARLGLDDARSWVVLAEANRFAWPGPDLRPRPGGDISTVAYGFLPRALFAEIRGQFISAVKARRATLVPRTD